MKVSPFRPLHTLLVLIPVSMVFVFIAGCSFEEEPRYKNMPVSQYIKTITTSEREASISNAIDALIEIGQPGVKYIVKAWQDNPDGTIQCRLASALEAIGPDAAEAVPVLVETLNEIDELQVSCAAFALGGIGPAAAPAKERLAELLRSSDSSTQVNVLYALGGIGLEASEYIPLIMEAVEREPTREAGIIALSNMGEPAVRAIQPWLEDGTRAQRLAACGILAEMGQQNIALVLDGLRTALKDPHPHVRIEAARALGSAGVYAAPVFPSLVIQLRDENDEVREVVVQSLVRIGPSSSKHLVTALEDRNWRAREGAARVISHFSSLVEEARVPLIRRLSDSNVHVRIASINALATLGESIVPDMISQLNSGDVLRRYGAATVLGKIGPPASPAIPGLQKLLRDRDTLVREAAQAAIKSIAGA